MEIFKRYEITKSSLYIIYQKFINNIFHTLFYQVMSSLSLSLLLFSLFISFCFNSKSIQLKLTDILQIKNTNFTRLHKFHPTFAWPIVYRVRCLTSQARHRKWIRLTITQRSPKFSSLFLILPLSFLSYATLSLSFPL
jgi:hypothetical protein